MSFNVEITESTGGAKPKPGQQIAAHYTGKLVDGTVFDSSISRGDPLKFKVGQGQVIRGWDEGFLQIGVGEKAIITCPPDYAYGANGAGGVIPPNATLTFEVQLVEIIG
mmetsp:Transcript_123278/g.239809  ORF Transcript_123278/g.239809 Transcript_123278/m.239809 type:complete len:109 (-) Transcript_123278:75-401(-)|eukprot:CAMPEP_0172659936 /NCGR_PEP_ID=MMETSP1074-20121228/3786_1 /TAXON_ID=2916 /ORGANISM="Ceratium fusus, Strain PA161109" /LENGTH=108 /DNA_ID=CAMNT_0013475517 /DNA_START=76 /DNA_END=402 /DNA_ORIENTATION=-